MGNVFGEFIQTAENAKAMIQKKFGKNLSGFQINRMALVKFFFFSKEEIKKYLEEKDIPYKDIKRDVWI